MTDPVMADATYIEPHNETRLEQIIAKERPDAILPNLGGQTGLNLSMALAKKGILDKYGVSSVVKNVGGAGGYDSCLENCCTADDPKLRGYGKFAFRPTSGSPCIDAGSKLSWMDETAVDIYGRPRVRGKGPDIGAAEFSWAGLMIQVR